MVRILLLFGLLGPPVGAIAYWSVGLQYSGFFTGPRSGFFTELISIPVTIASGLFMGMWDLPTAFKIGAIPAIVTGAGYWLTLEYMTKRNLAPLYRMLTGSMLAVPVTTAYGLAIGSKIPAYILIAPSAIAAAICAILIGDRWYSKVFPLRPGKGENFSGVDCDK